MALTGRAAAAALVGALVVLGLRTVPALLAVNGLLLAAILADLALAARVRDLRITRSGDTRVLLGETARTEVTVHNPGPRPVRAVLRAAWQPSAHATPGQAGLVLPAAGTGTVTSILTPDRRGDKVSPAVIVRSVGPCGLAARQAALAVPWTVRVLPPFGSRRHLGEKLSMLRQLEGQHRSLLRGPGTEFDSLREYVVGDDVRSIDWRAAARRGDVMVRTWRPERDRRILVVLDTGRTAAARVGGLPRLDAAMDATLLLAALASRAGDRIDLLAFDRRVRARVLGAPRSSVLASFTSAHGPAGSRADRDRRGGYGHGGAHRGPTPLPGHPGDRPEPGRDRGGPAAAAARPGVPEPGHDRRGQRPAAGGDGRRPRRPRRACTTPQPPRRRSLAARGSRPCSGNWASRWWTPRRTGCPPLSPTPTWPSNPRAACDQLRGAAGARPAVPGGASVTGVIPVAVWLMSGGPSAPAHCVVASVHIRCHSHHTRPRRLGPGGVGRVGPEAAGRVRRRSGRCPGRGPCRRCGQRPQHDGRTGTRSTGRRPQRSRRWPAGPRRAVVTG